MDDSTLTTTGTLPLRLGVGITFFMHGWLKLFGMGVAGVTGFFGSLGIPLPAVAAPAITALEMVGGAAIVAGLLTRPIAALLAGDMVVAIGLAKLRGGFFGPNGFELELMLLAGSLSLALLGAGSVSIDALLRSRRSRRDDATSAARTTSPA